MENTSQVYFQLLGGPLPYQNVVLFLDIFNYRLVKLVARYFYRRGLDYPDRDITAISVVPPPISTTIRAGGFGYVNTGTNSGGQRFFYQKTFLAPPAAPHRLLPLFDSVCRWVRI